MCGPAAWDASWYWVTANELTAPVAGSVPPARTETRYSAGPLRNTTALTVNGDLVGVAEVAAERL